MKLDAKLLLHLSTTLAESVLLILLLHIHGAKVQASHNTNSGKGIIQLHSRRLISSFGGFHNIQSNTCTVLATGCH